VTGPWGEREGKGKKGKKRQKRKKMGDKKKV
jgi:hypothetical protein